MVLANLYCVLCMICASAHAPQGKWPRGLFRPSLASGFVCVLPELLLILHEWAQAVFMA